MGRHFAIPIGRRTSMLKRLISTSVLVVLVGAASGASAFTSTSDKRTYFTFNQPVALPGVTLPPGTYMFRLADDTTSRKVIQIANKQGTESFAMLHTIAVTRPDVPREPEIRFMETASGAPVAVRAWWKDGERTGYGFIYSKEELANLNRAAAAAEPAAEARIEPPAAVDTEVDTEPAGEPVALPEEPLSGADVVEGEGPPSEEPALVAQAPANQQAPPASQPRQDPAQAPAREELPRTASPLALLLLTGLASAGIGLRLLKRS
jgi:hypothetical protein